MFAVTFNNKTSIIERIRFGRNIWRCFSAAAWNSMSGTYEVFPNAALLRDAERNSRQGAKPQRQNFQDFLRALAALREIFSVNLPIE